VVKRLHLIFEDQEYQRLREIKDRLGLTWEKFLLEAARCLEERAEK